MSFTRIGFLLASLALAGLAASSLSASVRNQNDLIWDAFGTQGATSMKAKYKESPENGLIDQSLEVQVEDAQANATLVVTINGRRVGRIVTNGFGDGRLDLVRLGVTPGPDGRPPANRRVETGDVIRVFNPSGGTDVSGAFQPRP